MKKPPQDLKGIAALLASQGRRGDTMLAHINPQEAALLKSLGGAGTVNPNTGLPEFWSLNLGPVRVGSDGVSYDPGWGLGIGNITGSGGLFGKTAGAIEGVAKQLGNTIEAIASDPRKLAAVGLMIAFPGAASSVGDFILGEGLAVDAAVASGAMSAAEASMVGASTLGSGSVASAIVGQAAINAATNGGDVESAVKAALIQQGLPAAMKSDVMQSLNKDMVDLFGKYGAQAATDAGIAAIMGKDPVAAFVFSGAKQAVNVMTKEIPGFDSLNGPAKSAINSVLLAKLSGKDAATAAANSLISSAVGAAKAYTQIQQHAFGFYNGKSLGAEQLAAIQNPEKVVEEPYGINAAMRMAGNSELTPEQVAEVTSMDPNSKGFYLKLIDIVGVPESVRRVTEIAKEQGINILPEQAYDLGRQFAQINNSFLDAEGLQAKLGYIDKVNKGELLYNPDYLRVAPVNGDPEDIQAFYDQLKNDPALRLPGVVAQAPNEVGQDVADATQQLIDAITNPGSTVSYPGTQLADAGRAGDPESGVYWDSSIGAWRVADEATNEDLEQLGVGLPTDAGSSQMTEQDLADIVSGGIGDATLGGGESTNQIADDGTTSGIQDVIDSVAPVENEPAGDQETQGTGAGATLTGDDGSTLTIDGNGNVAGTDATDTGVLTGGSGESDIIPNPNVEHYADGTYKVTYEDGTSAIFNADGSPYSTLDDTGKNTLSIISDDTSPSGFRDSLGQPVNADGTPYVAPTGNDTLTGGSSTVPGGSGTSTIPGGSGTSTVPGGGSGGTSTVPGGGSGGTGQTTVPGGSSQGLDLASLFAALGGGARGYATQAPQPIPVVGESAGFDFSEPLDVSLFGRAERQKKNQNQTGTTKISTGGYLDDLLDAIK